MRQLFIFILSSILFQIGFAQIKGYTPRIEPCDCAFKSDSGLKTTCAYLIVPENRNKPAGKTIKLPFIYVESPNPNKKKDPVLFTGGGPGSSSLGIVQFAHRRIFMQNRDFIAFEQRGTYYALPRLSCDEISEAIKKAYRDNLPKDSMILDGVKRCRENLVAQGIDLSGYNTVESAADIEDLRVALKIDSLNLFGVSYSGGLMLTVLRNYPSGIRSLILDSPLPEFINIDEEEILNFNEALHTIFTKCESDSADKKLYGNLEEKFRKYFSSIGGKTFSINYLEKGKKDSIKINYTRNELVASLENTIFNFSKIKDIPFIITEMIRGNHLPYIKEVLDGIFNGTGPSGMRLSVYCSDKMAYANERMINEQFRIHPYVTGAGFFINDVNMAMCKCWQVPPIAAEIKKPFYSNVPVLLGAGDTDPSCRELYNDMIFHFMPNSQRLLFIGRSHAPLIGRDGNIFIAKFLDDPYKKIESERKDIMVVK